MRNAPSIRLVLALFLIAAATLSSAARASDFPAKPVRLIVGYSPGGATDLVARILARTLTERWPQPMVVENRPGAAGNIASDLIAKAPPDGYTLMLAAPALAVNASLYKKLPFDPLADFRQVSMAAIVMNVFVVAPSMPVKTVDEFIQYAKKNPGKVNFVSSGVGASSHLAGELFKNLTGIDMVHVPYKGTSAYVADLVTGKVQAAFDSLPALLSQVQSGGLRALALSSPSRSPLLPNVPTMKEVGLPEYQVSVWLGVMGPAKLPDPVVAQLNKDINAALQNPALQKQIADIGGVASGSSPEEFTAFYRREIERYREVIVRTGASAD
jgi:tripartite-type tricarboxylate transporter receptor subunit TctC